MPESYDILVVGAGPAGGQAARDMAANDYDVALLERESRDDFPKQSNKSTAGTFPRMMTPFNIPDETVMDFTESVVLESENDFYRHEKSGAVLDYPSFKNFLVKDAEDKGADALFDTSVYEPIMGDGVVEGVRTTDGEEIYGDVIVDASGPKAVLAGHEDIGIVDLDRDNVGIGIEYEIEGVNLDPGEYNAEDGYPDVSDSMMFGLDHHKAPGGYYWIFDTGNDTAKVGVCYIQNKQHQEEAVDGKTIDNYLEEWIAEDPRFEYDSISSDDALSVHRGSAHIQLPTEYSWANVAGIGDVIPSVDPMWGEGIHTGMKAARQLAIVINQQLTPKKKGHEVQREDIDLSEYGERVEKYVFPNRTERMVLTQGIYLMDNERFDELMEDLRNADMEKLSELNNGSLKNITELAHLEDIPDLFRAGVETAKQTEEFQKAEKWVQENIENIDKIESILDERESESSSSVEKIRKAYQRRRGR